jgi:thiol:disulfide interchange protein DsbD
MPLIPRLRSLLLALSGVAALALAPGAARAVDQSDLLPIEEAFTFEARMGEDGRAVIAIEAAEGYYLYRHRFSARTPTAGASVGALELPPGEAKTDEFFGDVETYRGAFEATLAVGGGPGEVVLQIGYQGCADLGICYPPSRVQLPVTLAAALPPVAAAEAAAPAPGAPVPAIAPAPAPTPAGLPAAAPFGAPAPGLAAPFGAGPQAALPEDQAFVAEAIVADPGTLAVRITPAPGYYLYRDSIRAELEGGDARAAMPALPAGTAHVDEHFGEVRVYFEPLEFDLALARPAGPGGPATLVLAYQGCQADGICYSPMTRRIALALPPTETAIEAAGAAGATAPASAAEAASAGEPAATAPGAATTWWLALAFALGGGLVLNLMPCVLPVLSLKAISLAQSGEGRAAARRSALAYTVGVLLGFVALGGVALALRAAGTALGWGFQLQQPGMITALALLMVAVGLSLSGVFTIGGGLMGAGAGLAARRGLAGDFFTGLLAVVVATPCIAPLMGPALAYAFAGPALAALGVFAMLGLGLALPFLLIGFVPALADRLPRPGAWMDTFKQLLAFPMYLTAVWLLWVLAAQRGADGVAVALVAVVLLALGTWWRERLRFSDRRVLRALGWLPLLAALAAIPLVHRLPAPAATPAAGEAGAAVAFSEARVASLRAEGRVVIVNMTADWCVTCKLNERVVLGTDGFRDALARHGATYVVGDFTNEDPAIAAFLARHRAVGVPLYVVFPPGDPAAPGEILPTVLRLGDVEAALARAAEAR